MMALLWFLICWKKPAEPTTHNFILQGLQEALCMDCHGTPLLQVPSWVQGLGFKSLDIACYVTPRAVLACRPSSRSGFLSPPVNCKPRLECSCCSKLLLGRFFRMSFGLVGFIRMHGTESWRLRSLFPSRALGSLHGLYQL